MESVAQQIPLEHFLVLSAILFSIGVFGVLSRRNAVVILMSVELMLNAASVNVLAVNYHVANDPSVGQIIVLFIIGLAAAEAAIALSIILAVYRQRTSIDVANLEELKG